MSSIILDEIEKTKLDDVVADIVEIGVDSEIPDSLLREIPIAKTFYALVKAGYGISNYLFVKKISEFLFQMHKIDHEERKKLRKKIENESRYGENVGEKMMYLLDRYDDHEKSKLLAKALIAYSRDELSYEEFFRIAYGIDRLMLINMKYLKDANTEGKTDSERVSYSVYQNLADAGFVDFHTGWNNLISSINEVGQKFLKFVVSR